MTKKNERPQNEKPNNQSTGRPPTVEYVEKSDKSKIEKRSV
jgi:hypothetical protein